MHQVLRSARPLLVAALALAAMMPVVSNGFLTLNGDDPNFATPEACTVSFAPASLIRLFSAPRNGVYAPLVTLSHALVYRVLTPGPAAAHAINLLLHAVNAVLVLWLFEALGGRRTAAVFAAALFAVHPLNVEPVAWATERTTLVAVFFYLNALLAYIRYVRSRSPVHEAVTAVCFLAALLSKPIALTLPLALLLVDRTLKGKVTLPDIRRKWYLFLFSAQSVVVTMLTTERRELSEHGLWRGWINDFSLSAFTRMPVYLYKIFLPLKLSIAYPIGGASVLGVAFALLFLAGLLIVAWKARTGKPMVFFGTLFFLVTLAPMLPWFGLRIAPLADRYSYLPMIGVLCAITGAFPGTPSGAEPSRVLRILGAGAVITLIGSFAALSAQRASVWKDDATLWKDVDRQYPGVFAAAYANLGTHYLSVDQADTAVEYFDRALAIDPDYPLALHNRGNSYLRQGRLKEAMDDLNRALPPGSTYAEAYASRAQVEAVAGRWADALADIDIALTLRPALPRAAEFRAAVTERLADNRQASAHAD